MHIYDREFIRGEIPMTKQEVRAITVGKLQLTDDSILIDVGAGTGSVSIESSTYLSKGKVYAIEKESLGCELIKKNSEKFNCKNIEIIQGRAPENIPKVPFNRMFIGGSGGELEKILKFFLQYSDENSKIVLNIIALESLNNALSLLKKLNFKNIEVCNINVSRGKSLGNYTMMTGENPIYIISGDK